MVNLTKDERYQFCDPNLYRLIQFIIVAVNQSYLLLGFDKRYKEEEMTKLLLQNEADIEEWNKDRAERELNSELD